MTIRTLIFVVASLLAPAAAMAAPPTWVVDKGVSHLTFASSVSGEAFTGAFRRWDAAIRFDPKDLAHSSVLATIDVTSSVTGNGDRDSALPDQDWFWTSHFPRATFAANAFRMTAPGHYVATGVLTLRGAARPVALPFALTISGPVAHMTGQVVISRLAFGVGQGEFQATDTVPANVTVGVDLTAHRAP
jgi:polyisoprenoid-binding protein YceI